MTTLMTLMQFKASRKNAVMKMAQSFELFAWFPPHHTVSTFGAIWSKISIGCDWKIKVITASVSPMIDLREYAIHW